MCCMIFTLFAHSFVFTRSMNSLFVSGQQQDSHELLRCLLAFIQEAVHQLNCCRTGLRALQNNDSPLVNGHGTSGTCDDKRTSATNDANIHNGFGKNAKSRAEKETRNKKKTEEVVNSGKQPRKRSKLQLNEGSNKNVDQNHITTKNKSTKQSNSPQSFSRSETSGDSGSLKASVSSDASLSPQTLSNSEPTSSKGGRKASNSSLTKSGIMSYFGAALKPRSLDEIALRTELISDFVESLCQGRMEQQTRCLECEQVTRSVEDFQDLALPVKRVAKSRVRRSSSDSEDDGKVEDAGSTYFSLLCFLPFLPFFLSCFLPSFSPSFARTVLPLYFHSFLPSVLFCSFLLSVLSSFFPSFPPSLPPSL